MLEIHIFKDGSYTLIDPTTTHIQVNGEEPVEVLPATEENLANYPRVSSEGAL